MFVFASAGAYLYIYVYIYIYIYYHNVTVQRLFKRHLFHVRISTLSHTPIGGDDGVSNSGSSTKTQIN